MTGTPASGENMTVAIVLILLFLALIAITDRTHGGGGHKNAMPPQVRASNWMPTPPPPRGRPLPQKVCDAPTCEWCASNPGGLHIIEGI